MTHQAERLDPYIRQILSGRLPVDLSELEQMDKNTFELHIYEMIRQLNEVYEFYDQLSQGNLQHSASPGNALLGPAKDLQASLRHLLWQVERVAQGDYNNRVEFLGDFSKAFNIYIEQVALREEYQKKVTLLEKNNLEQKNRILSGQLEQQLAHYEKLKQVYQKIRGIRHDLKNHFFALDELLSHKDIEGAQDYLHSFMSDIFNANYRIYDTQNPILDALLTEKLAWALQAGIQIDTDITIRPDIHIDNVDLCILFGNALDNAIEACRCLNDADKKITIKMLTRKSLLNVVIRNTALPPVKGTNGFYETSKQDKLNHGLGLTNISEVVTKYDGAVQTEYKDGYFTLTCMLCGV